MSSSGRGQSLLRDLARLDESWTHAQEGPCRSWQGDCRRLRSFLEYEITLLTVRAVDGIHFCEPIGHRQEDGDYRESWQPQAMSELAPARSKEVAAKVVEALGGYGLFGSSSSSGVTRLVQRSHPRPHDTRGYQGIGEALALMPPSCVSLASLLVVRPRGRRRRVDIPGAGQDGGSPGRSCPFYRQNRLSPR